MIKSSFYIMGPRDERLSCRKEYVFLCMESNIIQLICEQQKSDRQSPSALKGKRKQQKPENQLLLLIAFPRIFLFPLTLIFIHSQLILCRRDTHTHTHTSCSSNKADDRRIQPVTRQRGDLSGWCRHST